MNVRNSLTGVVFVFMGLALLGIVPDSGAAGDTVKEKKKKTTKYDPVFKILKNADNLIDKANHDYGGHRAKADHEVEKALHLLHHGKDLDKFEHKRKIVESQPRSDAQLREAAKEIENAIRVLMPKADTKHEKKAVMHLQNAVRELELALKFVASKK